MPEQSVYTRVALSLGERLAQMRKDAGDSKAIPFGMEEVTADTETRRLRAMGPKERQEYIQRNGLQKTLEVARRGQRNAKAK